MFVYLRVDFSQLTYLKLSLDQPRWPIRRWFSPRSRDNSNLSSRNRTPKLSSVIIFHRSYDLPLTLNLLDVMNEVCLDVLQFFNV
jgi:hypothetical protein